jgi:hypothetical protein
VYPITLILALAAPLLLLPIEAVLPYPHVIEEIVKLALVWMVLTDRQLAGRQKWLAAGGLGAAFTVSETILYAQNFLWLGSADRLAERLLITGSLHVGTALLLFFCGRYRRWAIWLGLLLAIAIHWQVNAWLGLAVALGNRI